MNNKRVKKLVGCVCALTLLIGAIPMNFIQANAEDSAVETTSGVEFYNAVGTKMEDAQYSLHGVFYDETAKVFARMKSKTAADIAAENDTYKLWNESLAAEGKEWVNTVYSLSREAAGGRIRFNTNSTTIKIEAELYQWDASHVSHAASMNGGKYGFDVYVDTADGSTYVDTAIAETKDEDGNGKVDPGSVFVNKTIALGEAASRDITIYFPITIETKNVKITVDDNSEVNNHVKGYDGNGRLVFYGSSITQGGCATKPGNTYVNTVGRNLNMEYIDFGMWGRCKGEQAFAEYIAGLGDISAFVYDFDHNISKVSSMEPVHYPFYEIIREAYPDIPIIMMTRPGNGLDTTRVKEPEKGYSTVAEMKEVIRNSYEKAKANGDENVHFVDGESFFNYSEGYMQDNSHPNDAGQARMAEVVTAVLEKVFAGEKNLCVEPVDCEILLNEDFTYAEGHSVTNYWEPTISSKAVTSDFGVVQDANENDVYQLKYERGSAGACISSVKYQDKVLEGVSDFAVEMNTVLEYGADYSYLGLAFGQVDTTDRYEIRLTPTSGGYKLSLIDRSDGENDTVGETSINNSKFKDNWKKEAISYKIRVEVRNVVIGTVESQQVVVVVDEEVVAAYTLVLKDQAFSPETIDMYLYTRSSAQGLYTATVDNIKVYGLSHKLSSVAEIPATTEVAGTKAHYVCDLCEKKFLDEDGIIPATDANLALAKNCVLLNEDFESGVANWDIYDASTYDEFSVDTIKKDDETSVGRIRYVRTGSASNAYMQYGKGILDGKTDYVLEMDDVSIYHSADTKRWSSLGLMFRQRATEGQEASTLEFRIQGSSTGLSIVPYYDGTKYDSSDYSSLGYLKIADSDIGSAYTAKDGTPLNFDLRLEVSGIGSEAVTCKFIISTQEKQIVLPNFACEPTGFRINLYGGGSSDSSQEYKATFDDIRICTGTHDLSYMEKVASTNDIAGATAHYECDACGKKFSNSTATAEVTDAELAYAKLTDIKYQTRVNENGLTDIRFVAFVDDYTQYQSVSFKITLTSSGKSGTAECKDVYTAVYAGGTKYKTDDIYSVEGYFAAFKLTNNTEADLAEEMTVLVTWTDLEGNTRTSERTITISEAQ